MAKQAGVPKTGVLSPEFGSRRCRGGGCDPSLLSAAVQLFCLAPGARSTPQKHPLWVRPRAHRDAWPLAFHVLMLPVACAGSRSLLC
jgi:hypothetical protein